MKNQYEKINAFKEVILLISFLLVLFSFSNKSFGRRLTDDKQGLERAMGLFPETNVAVAPQDHSIPGLTKIPAQDLPGMLYINGKFSGNIHNTKIETLNKLYINDQLLLKPEHPCRFYYLVFSHQEEALPA